MPLRMNVEFRREKIGVESTTVAGAVSYLTHPLTERQVGEKFLATRTSHSPG